MRCLTIVRFPADPSLDPARLSNLIRESIPRFQGIPGLRRKVFIGNDTTGGGVYEWDSRAAADAYFNETWTERMHDVYGAVPTVEFFDLHAVVDNASGRVEIAD